jgi:hypothetical protein
VFQSGESAHWRFECQGDPIPVFPFLLQGMHTGSLAYLSAGSSIVDLVRSEQHIGRRAFRSVSTKPTQRHRITFYLNLLTTMVAIRDLPPKSTSRRALNRELNRE